MLLKTGNLSAVELTELLLDRIEDSDKNLNCYITAAKDSALKKAKDVQFKLDKGITTGALAGIPVSIKDNICTKGILTTCASKMLSNYVPPYNAEVIDKLSAADTIMLGKLNMDEFGMGSTTEFSYYGSTKNPWNTTHVPGGSSGGTAAAVASGEAIIGLGSDTGGSVRQPAAFCGMVGLKPTYGAISRRGLVAFASSLDHIGIISKDVTDSALMLNAIAGHDPGDETSVKMEHADYTSLLIDKIDGLRIGIPRELLELDINQEVRACFDSALKQLQSLGAVVDEFSLPMTDYAVPAYHILSCAEGVSNLSRFDGVRYGFRARDYKNTEEMYRKTRGEGFGPEVKRRIMFGTFVLSAPNYNSYYRKAVKARAMIAEQYEKALSRFDAVISPTTPTTAYCAGQRAGKYVDTYMDSIFLAFANLTGLPAISVPCGFDSAGMPVGLQLVGKRFSEGTILRIAYAFEQNTDYHLRRPML